MLGHGTEMADLHLPIKLNGDLALFQAHRLAAGAMGRPRPRLHRHVHHRIRPVAGRTSAPSTGRSSPTTTGSVPRADHRARANAARLRRHRVLLGDGSDPAPQCGGHHQRGLQSGVRAGQHRQARRRAVPGPRPLQRAGRPHDGHLGARTGALPGCAAEGIRVRPAAAARPGHRRFDPRAARWKGALLPGPRRQLRAGGVGHRRRRRGDAQGRA